MRHQLFLLILALLVSDCDGWWRRRRRRRSPPPNNAPSISCPRVNEVTAGSMSTSANVYWANPTVSDDHGGWRLNIISGRTSGSVFTEGTHTITYRVTDSGGISRTCSFSFRVRVTRCSALASPRNGRMSCNGNNIYGRRCSFSCNTGYRMVGNSVSTCRSNGQNSNNSPSCAKKRCGNQNLPSKSVGVQCSDGQYYGSECSLRCDSKGGYKPRLHSYAKCLANTSWSYLNWGCEDTEKPRFLTCPSADLKTYNSSYTWPDVKASDNSGSVTVTQRRGPKPNEKLVEGVQIVEYVAKDASGNVAPPCVFTVIYEVPACTAPVSGDGDFEPQFTCNNHKVGASCKASCPYSIVVGAKYIICKKSTGVVVNPTWAASNGQYPTCYKRHCPDLKAPVNGALVCDKFLGGETCQVQCNRNYDVPHEMKYLTSFFCGRRGWSPLEQAPECTEMSFPDAYSLPTEIYYFGGDCADKKTNAEIRQNFITNLIQAAILESKTEKCSVENVQVTCGPVEKGDDIWGDAFFSGMKRAANGVSLPASTTVQGSLVSTTTPSPETTTPTFSSVGSTQGTGQVNPRKWKITLKFDFAISNVSSVISTDIAVALKDRILNRTSLMVPVKFKQGITGDLSSSCGPGKVPSNNSAEFCVPCPRGFYHNDTGNTCDPCRPGTYSNTTGQTSCTQCQDHYSTLSNRSMSQEECKPTCQPGQYSDSGFVPCSTCPDGTFQSEYFGTQCTACPEDTTTYGNGSDTKQNCVPFDVMIEGPERLSLGPVLPESVKDFTLAFWIHSSELGVANINFTLSHPTLKQRVTLELSTLTKVKVNGEDVPIRAGFPSGRWAQMALVLTENPRHLDIYRWGARVVVYGGQIPDLVLGPGTELTIDIGKNSSATLREIYVIPHSNTSDIISNMANSCNPDTQGYKSLLSRIKPSDNSKISIVVPGVCSGMQGELSAVLSRSVLSDLKDGDCDSSET